MPALEQAQQQADEQRRDERTLAALALAAFLLALPDLRSELLLAVRHNRAPETATAGTFGKLSTTLTDTAIASYLMGRLRAIGHTTEALRKYHAGNPAVATDFLRTRNAVSEADLVALRAVYRPRVLDQLARLMVWLGRSMAETAAPAPGAPEETESALPARLDVLGLTAANPYSLTRVVEDVVHGAYDEGGISLDHDPLARQVLLGYEYVSQRDAKVRPTHRAADGDFAAVDDPHKLQYFSSLLQEPSCRCERVAIYGVPGTPPQLI